MGSLVAARTCRSTPSGGLSEWRLGGNRRRAVGTAHRGEGIAWGVFGDLLAASVFDSGVAIALFVASVASGIKSPGFQVDEMAESRKLVHIIYRSISIADIGVGARGESLLPGFLCLRQKNSSTQKETEATEPDRHAPELFP
jgi:hypothetical protein